MGDFVGKVVDEVGGFGDKVAGAFGLPPVGDVVKGLTGQTGAEAALSGARLQYQSSEDAREQLERLNQPFLDAGRSALPGLMSFTNDPSGYSFLENNPLFNAAIDNANRVVGSSAASRGKFNSGGTVDQLFKNYLTIGDQFANSAFNRLLAPATLGQNAASFQGTNSSNLITGGGNALAAGGIGAANSYSQGSQNIAGLAAMAAAAFSDERLKDDMEPIGRDADGLTVYRFKYKDFRPEFVGYSAQEVANKHPDSVFEDESGYLKVTGKFKPVRVS